MVLTLCTNELHDDLIFKQAIIHKLVNCLMSCAVFTSYVVCELPHDTQLLTKLLMTLSKASFIT